MQVEHAGMDFKFKKNLFVACAYLNKPECAYLDKPELEPWDDGMVFM